MHSDENINNIIICVHNYLLYVFYYRNFEKLQYCATNRYILLYLYFAIFFLREIDICYQNITGLYYITRLTIVVI